MKYLADDGTVFDDIEDALTYEENYLNDYVPKILKYLEDEGFNPEEFGRFLFNIFEDEEFNYKQDSLKN